MHHTQQLSTVQSPFCQWKSCIFSLVLLLFGQSPHKKSSLCYYSTTFSSRLIKRFISFCESFLWVKRIVLTHSTLNPLATLATLCTSQFHETRFCFDVRFIALSLLITAIKLNLRPQCDLTRNGTLSEQINI